MPAVRLAAHAPKPMHSAFAGHAGPDAGHQRTRRPHPCAPKLQRYVGDPATKRHL